MRMRGREPSTAPALWPLEREAGVDLSPKRLAGKTPTQALYDGYVEAALVPVARRNLYSFSRFKSLARWIIPARLCTSSLR